MKEQLGLQTGLRRKEDEGMRAVLRKYYERVGFGIRRVLKLPKKDSKGSCSFFRELE